MTDIQKLIATEIVKQREEQMTWKRRIDSLEVAKIQSPRLLELAKAEYRISVHIDETLSDILPKVSALIKAEQTPKKYVYKSIIDGSVNAMEREDALLDDGYERYEDTTMPNGRLVARYRKEVA